MSERAARIGAVVDVESESGAGSVVTLTLPQHPVVIMQPGPQLVNPPQLIS